MEKFSRPRTNGINAITINEGDELLEAKLSNGQNDIVIANRNGRAIRFPEEKVRAMGRSAAGVRGVRLDDDKNDVVVGMLSVNSADPEVTIFVISEKGSGKRSALEEYRITNRGGKGVKTMNVTDKTGKVVAVKYVTTYDHLMITTVDGIMIRMAAADLRVMGRATQGVRVINLGKKDSIADVAVIRRDENSDEEE
jgi:DNA gyrase subunit A